MLDTEYLHGKRVLITNTITKDAQARKHRKKRINKKWLKRYGYKAVPDDTKVVATNDTIFMTKRCFQRLKKKIDSRDGGFQKCYEELTRNGGREDVLDCSFSDFSNHVYSFPR